MIPIDGPYQIKCDGQSGGHFVWSDCGMELNFPADCSQQQIEISISAFLPIRNVVYPGVHIVSAVYQFHCNVEKFDKKFTLCLEHCVKLQSADDCNKMCFIIQHGGNNMKYGRFEVGNSHGTVNLDRFCCVYISWISELWKSIQVEISSDSHNQGGEDDQNFQDSCSVIISDQPHSKNLQTASDVSQSDNGTCSQPSDSQQRNLLPVPSVMTNVSPSSFDEEQKKITNNSSPVYKYEQLLALPRCHYHLTNWSGAYCIHKKHRCWREVRKFVVAS